MLQPQPSSLTTFMWLVWSMVASSARKSLNSPLEFLRIRFTATGLFSRLPLYTAPKPPCPICLENCFVAVDRWLYSNRLTRLSFPKESYMCFNRYHDSIHQIANNTAKVTITAPPITNARV